VCAGRIDLGFVSNSIAVERLSIERIAPVLSDLVAVLGKKQQSRSRKTAKQYAQSYDCGSEMQLKILMNRLDSLTPHL
jgi:hypothetical protein